MDAKRYQQINEVFWEAQDIEPNEREAFVRQHASGDEDLFDEVMSLLAEHNTEAALLEGRSAEPVSLPEPLDGVHFQRPPNDPSEQRSSEQRSSEETETKSQANTYAGTASSTQTGLPPTRRLSRARAEPTVHGAQRTHAAPRQAVDRRVKPTPSSSRTLTSIGPKYSRWSWLPLWLATAASLLIPIWWIAWRVGHRELRQDAQLTRTSLRAVLDDAAVRIRDNLETGRQIAVVLGQSDFVIQQALQSESISPEAWSAETRQLLKRFPIAHVVPPNANEKAPRKANVVENLGEDLQCSLWSRDMQRIGASQQADQVSPTPLSPEGASLVAMALSGHEAFHPPVRGSSLFPSSYPEDAISMGWVVPVLGKNQASESNNDHPPKSIAALLVRNWIGGEQLDEILRLVCRQHGVDAYLVDRNGTMLTNSPIASFLAQRGQLAGEAEQLAGRFRVAEPSEESRSTSDPSNDYFHAESDAFQDGLGVLHESLAPLTVSAAGVASTKATRVQMTPYRNYTGRWCQGSWAWFEEYNIGLIVERPSSSTPGPLSRTWNWALLLSLVSVAVASALSFVTERLRNRENNARRPLGRYAIREELGAGGMGVVYRAHHTELGREIALKVLRSDRNDLDDQQRFDREARLAATLSSPHSVTIYDYGRTEEGNAFCVMQLLEGLTLSEVIARGGAQEQSRVIWILRQVCQSISEAHARGMVHRDLKPQNIMLRFDRVFGDWAVVFDFGLAKPLESDQSMFQTAETIWAGTPMYMAPERFREPSVMDPRSDLYSIGCIAYYLLAGHPPFAECDPESMFALILTERPIEIATHRDTEFDPKLNELVRECMAKNKQERIGSIVRLAEQLDRLAEQHPWTVEQAEQWWQTHAKEELEA